MKPNMEEINRAVQRMAALVPFFPTGEIAHSEIALAIDKFCATTQALEWMTNTAVNNLTAWKGLAELRGIYCSKFRPADGIEADATTPGFTPADCEAEHQKAVSDETQKRIAEWKKQQLAIEGETAVTETEEIRRRIEAAVLLDRKSKSTMSLKSRLAANEAQLTEDMKTGIKLSDEEKKRRVRELEEKLGITS